MGERALSQADQRKNLASIDRAPTGTGTGRSDAHEDRVRKTPTGKAEVRQKNGGRGVVSGGGGKG